MKKKQYLFKSQEQELPSFEEEHECPLVMVVDDIPGNRMPVVTMLGLIFKIKSIEAENGKDCIDKLITFFKNKRCTCPGIKIVLMDIEMPVMDGITATKELMKQIHTHHTIPSDIKIIALTAYLDEKANCIKAGMSDFMTKPTGRDLLHEML